MIDLDGLLRYLSEGPCVAWVGAGPSVEMGMKSWSGLAAGVLEETRRQKKSNFSKLEECYRTRKYPQFFGEVQRAYGWPFLLDNCQKLLQTDKNNGQLYEAISRLPFVSYFTTNFDNLLYEAVSKRRAVKPYLNDKDDIASVDIHSIPSIVQLHGSLAVGTENTLVLTDDQYRLWYEQGEKEYFQQFLKVHLGGDRMVFIGYSLNDPEIQAIQKRLAANLRRKIPAIAIVSNVTEADLDYWERELNVSVMRYTARNDDHSELVHLLNIAARFLGGVPVPAQTKVKESIIAQKFYLWHKFEHIEEKEVKIDGLKSVLLSTANDLKGDTFSCDQILENIKDMVPGGIKLATNISSCCEELRSEGWLTNDAKVAHRYRLTQSAKDLMQQYGRQYDNLISVFVKQVQLDLQTRTSNSDSLLLEKAANVVLDILCDVFSIRGVEIVNLAFSKSPIPLTGANDILAIIWNRAIAIADMNIAFAVTNYTVDLLTKPQGVAEQVVDYLSRAFVSMQALRISAGEDDLMNAYFANQAFLVDENVLIPLLAIQEPRHELCVSAVNAAIEKGVLIFTTDYFVHEVLKHGNWARDLISRYGEQSAQVFMAAKGEAEFSSNAFLDGYIKESQNHNLTSYSFNDYLMQCTGVGAFSRLNFGIN